MAKPIKSLLKIVLSKDLVFNNTEYQTSLLSFVLSLLLWLLKEDF